MDCIFKSDLNVILVDPGERLRKDESRSDSESTTSEMSRYGSVECALSPIDLPSAYLNQYFQLQLRSCMLEEYFPSAMRKPASVAWLEDVQDLSFSDPLLNDALDALSYSNVERQAAVQYGASTDRSRMLYAKTIRRLSGRLADPDEVSNDATLAAVMVLAAYEV